MASSARGRTPQNERRARTVSALLDAALESLAEVGYAATNARVVARRAGVSQGAATYHFPSRAELIVAALEELANRSEAQLRSKIPSLPRGARKRRLAVIDLLHELFSGPLFVAWARLWFAAAEDEELRDEMRPVERRAWNRLIAAITELLPELADDPVLPARLSVVFSTLRGLGLQESFDPRRDERRLQTWPAHRAAIALILDADSTALGGRRPTSLS
jgi:AcrR family transcriptional regulator